MPPRKSLSKAKARALIDDDDAANAKKTLRDESVDLWAAVADEIQVLKEAGHWPSGQPQGLTGLAPIPADWTGSVRLDRAFVTLADLEWAPGLSLVTTPEVLEARRFWWPAGRQPDPLPTIIVNYDDSSSRLRNKVSNRYL